MFSWFFTWRRKRQLRKQSQIQHKLKLNTHKLKAACVSEINELYHDVMKAFDMLSRKLEVKDKKMKIIHDSPIDKNQLEEISEKIESSSTDNTQKTTLSSNETKDKYPQAKIEKMKSEHRFFSFILFLFIIAESGLYYLTAQVFLPGGSEIPKIILALFFGLVIMAVLNFSFESHFEYREYLAQRGKPDFSEEVLKNKRDFRITGYVLAVLSFFIILWAALVRINYLEQMDLSGYSVTEAENLKMVGKWASYLTLTVTFALAIFLAVLKKQQKANAIEYKVYKMLRKTRKKLNIYKQDQISAKGQFENGYMNIIEIHWQLVKEMEVIWEIEYDAQDKDLFESFKEKKRKGNLIINSVTYKQYEDILYADYELFKFGVERDAKIAERLDYIRTNFYKSKEL